MPPAVAGGDTMSRLETDMKVFRFACCLTLCVLLATGAPPAAAPRQAAPPQDAAVLAAARAVMQAVRYCALITSDASGVAQARTMDAFPPDEGLVVWMATNPRSRKVEQLRRDARVTLHYYDAGAPDLGYVTLYGRARLIDARAEKQARWKEGWEAFWPDRDGSYLLIEVTPERVEVFSPRHRIEADPVTWKPAGADLVKARPRT